MPIERICGMILFKPAFLKVHARVIPIPISGEKKQSHVRASFRNNGSVPTYTNTPYTRKR